MTGSRGVSSPHRILLVLVVLAAGLAPSAARAQSCWPVAVRLAVYDEAGRRMDPAALDSAITDFVAPLAPEPRVFGGAGYVPPVRGDTANVLHWSVAGCDLELESATLYRGGREMRLIFGIVLDSDTEGVDGPATYLVEAPPFQPGTFRLEWDAPPGGTDEEPTRIPAARWRPDPSAPPPARVRRPRRH